MFSFVNMIAIGVNRAMLPEVIMLALGINTANVLELIFEADPIKVSVMNKSIFFLFKDLFYFL